MASLTKEDREDVVEAWYMDESDDDKKLPHHRSPKQCVPLGKLDELGVLIWRLDADNYEIDPKLKQIREARGYTNMESYDIYPEKISNYEEVLKSFYIEHFHTADEVTFCVSGSGYYDVRDSSDEAWIRIWVKKGVMIALPAGIYHRVTVDNNDFLKIMTFFADEPITVAYNRSDDHLPIRKKYVGSLVKMGVDVAIPCEEMTN